MTLKKVSHPKTLTDAETVGGLVQVTTDTTPQKLDEQKISAERIEALRESVRTADLEIMNGSNTQYWISLRLEEMKIALDAIEQSGRISSLCEEARKEERERCAKIVTEANTTDLGYYTQFRAELAAVIRSTTQPPKESGK